MDKGTVKRWLTGKGYGFIDVDGEDRYIFVHHSEVKGIHALREGVRVEFNIMKTYKGLKAVNVQLVAKN